MSDDPTTTGATLTRSELLQTIGREWDELRKTIEGIGEEQLTEPGPDGWTIKDHLAHLAHWEIYLLAVLEGRDGRAELFLEPDQKAGEDEINAGLQKRDAALPLAEVRRRLDEAHANVIARLETLDEADLQHHMPHIRGNTAEHLSEHRSWIRSRVGAST